jgi:parallel beta-helix repeat protein
MQNSMWTKGMILGIICLFIGACVVPSTVGITNEKTVFMNLTSRGYIQGLIDNSSDGDTILIPSGTYYENIIINKSITLIGEDPNTTIIDGGGNYSVITVIIDGVTISGFTIQNSGSIAEPEFDSGIKLCSDNNIIHDVIISYCYFGISLTNSTSNNRISENSISYNYNGIYMTNSCNNTILGNTVSLNSDDGILLWPSSNYNLIKNNTVFSNGWGGIRLGDGSGLAGNVTGNVVMGNNASYNFDDGIGIEWSMNNSIVDNIVIGNYGNSWSEGVSLYHASYCEVTGNTAINNNQGGVGLQFSHNNKVTKNTIKSNKQSGISIGSSTSNTIEGNNITSNNISGVFIENSSNNTIYHNNFIGNTQNAYSDGANIWDDGKKGNYWDDYEAKYPDAHKKWWKGIWDTPYEIPGGDNTDRYPLIKQWPKTLSVSIPKIKIFNFNFDLLQRLIERFPNAFPILRHLLGY